MDKNKKIILIVIILLVLGATAVILLVNKPKNQLVTPTVQTPVTTQSKTEEEKEIIEPFVLKGEVTNVDLTSLTFKGPDGKEQTYTVPSENAKFFQEIDKDGAATLVEIGLFEIELNKTVELDYDPETNEVISVKVLK